MKIIEENSRFRVVWEIFIILLAMVSIFKIPYDLVFENSNYLSSLFLVLVIDILFILDIFLNFHCSYRESGIEILNPDTIKNNYLKKYFKVDLIANFPFDLIALFLLKDFFVYGISIVLIMRLLKGFIVR